MTQWKIRIFCLKNGFMLVSLQIIVNLTVFTFLILM